MGAIFSHIFESLPQFAYSLYNFYGATMTFKGRLQGACPILKLLIFQRKVFKYSQNWAPNSVFGKRGVEVKFWFCNPEKAHPCAKPHLLSFSVFLRQCRGGVLAVDERKNPKKSQANNLVLPEVACAETKPLIRFG